MVKRKIGRKVTMLYLDVLTELPEKPGLAAQGPRRMRRWPALAAPAASSNAAYASCSPAQERRVR